MKRNRIFTAIGLITAVWFSACTNEEPMDPNALPEGKYPLEIASVTMSVESSSEPWNAKTPQTRVTENADGMSSVWEWDGTERIGVQLYADDDDVATYTLNADKTLTPDKTLYWKNKEQTTVMAWYPAYEGESGTVSLADQSGKLAYVLKGSGTGNYNTPVVLSFEHALAKIRVKLMGNKADKVTDVKIKSFTSCTHTNGTDIQGNDEGWITMQQVAEKGYWETNVVPSHPITDFQVNGVKGTLNNGITPEKGKLHEINITVEGQLQHIDLSTITESTLTVSGEAVITGKNDNLQITIEPDAQVTLKDIDLTYNEGPTIICQGDAHITLSGKNRLSATSKSQYDPSTIHDLGSGIEMRSAGTLTIESEAESSLEITRKTVDSGGLPIPYGAGIGLCSNANLIIKGGQFVVTGGSPSRSGGANIGGIYSEKSVGTITIEGGKFTLQDKCMASSFVGAGSYGTCGTVTIRAGVTINGTTYTEDHIGEIE